MNGWEESVASRSGSVQLMTDPVCSELGVTGGSPEGGVRGAGSLSTVSRQPWSICVAGIP